MEPSSNSVRVRRIRNTDRDLRHSMRKARAPSSDKIAKTLELSEHSKSCLISEERKTTAEKHDTCVASVGANGSEYQAWIIEALLEITSILAE